MSNLTQCAINLQAQRDACQRQTDALNKKLTETLAKIHREARPKCPEDGIYAFSIRFKEGGEDYQHAAVINESMVSITGRMSRILTWDEFLDWMERKAKEADFVSSLLQLQSSGVAHELLSGVFRA